MREKITKEEYKRRDEMLEHLEDALSDITQCRKLDTKYKAEEIEHIYNELQEITQEIYNENFKPDKH